METVVQLGLVFLLCAVPAIGATWFTERGGDVLADAFRPMSGQPIPLDEAWPRGVQEEEPRTWGAPVSAKRPAVSERTMEAATATDQLPDLQRVRRA